MGCVRRRGRSWNAQVRVAGWQSFTKSFGKKSDALRWVQELEQTLKNAPRPRVNSNDISLFDLLQRYGLEVSSQLKGSEKEPCKLNRYARHPIAQNRLSNPTPLHLVFAPHRCPGQSGPNLHVSPTRTLSFGIIPKPPIVGYYFTANSPALRERCHLASAWR